MTNWQQETRGLFFFALRYAQMNVPSTSVKLNPMEKKKPKYPLVVSVIPNSLSQRYAMVQAKLKFTEGEAVFDFSKGSFMDKGLAETIAKALEESNLRQVDFESESKGSLWVMWKEDSREVRFFVTLKGGSYLQLHVKRALEERVSQDE